MTRFEILDAASFKLAEAVILLAQAGERRLAADVEELADLIEFRAWPFVGEQAPGRTQH